MVLSYQPVLNPLNPVTSLPVAPASPPVPALPPAPTFQDIVARLSQTPTINGVRPIGGQASTDAALAQIQPSTGLRPEIQNVLDMIRKNTDEARAKGIAEASSLAAKRGITGSSTEFFGTQTAAGQAEKAGRDAEAQILLQNAQREQALQDLRAKILAERGGQEATVGAQLGINEANLTADQNKALASLTSDEIASLRNMDFANRQLAIQKLLGEQGIAVSRDNIQASKDVARQTGQNNLWQAGISAIIPSLLGDGKGGDGLFKGLVNRLFGGGTTAAGVPAVAGAGGIPSAADWATYTGAPGAAGTPAALGGLTAGNALPAAGLGFLGAKGGQAVFGGGNDVGGAVGAGAGAVLGGPVGAAVGGFIGTGLQRGQEAVDKAVTKKLGNTVGSLTRLATNPVQGIKDIGSHVSNAVNKVFGAGSTGVNIGGQQRGMNELFGQANELKAALANGQIDQASYAQAINDINKQAITLYHQTASLGNKAANNIRGNFDQFVSAGFISPNGNDSYISNAGDRFSSQQL